MSYAIRSGLAAALLAVLAIPCQGWAAGAGQEDLDRAATLKRTAKTTGDLGEVIRLLDAALEAGLEEGHADFARSLLAASLIERGTHFAGLVEEAPTDIALVPQLRKAALDDLERAVELSPEQPQALFSIARLNLLPGGDAPRGREALERTIELTAEEPELLAKALKLRADLETDLEKKLADLNEAIRIIPENLTGLRARARIQAEMGKLEEALADLDMILELEPRNADNYYNKVVILRELRRYDEALVSLDKVHELTPDSVLPLLRKAEVHILQSNFDAALHELDRAHTMDPQSVAVLLLRAGTHLQKGEREKALADTEAALKLDPQMPGAMRLRAALLADAGNRDEAIAMLEGLRKAVPEEPSTLLQLGILYSVDEDYEHAIDAFSAALAEDPNEPTALRGRGDALLNLGKHKEAIADFETLVKLQPEDHGALNNLAWILATSPEEELRDGKRAVELATHACEMTEYKAAYILSTLAAAYAETGDFPAAIGWIEKGLEVAEEDDEQSLHNELESYRNGKPWRELLSEGKHEDPPVEEP